MSDIEIAQSIKPQHIRQIAEKLGVSEEHLDYYGKYKAKLSLDLVDREKSNAANLILVTAITPTPAGEGKTTVSIGLADGLNLLGHKTTVVLREPSLGPVFGIKGGAAGGGWSQVIPMEDINLHFTGDFSAVEKANNLLSALIDNNLQSKEKTLGLDPRTILWKRVMDMNDRSLRHITIGLGGKSNGIPRETGFNITAASEVMAILCLSESITELKERFSNIYIGDTWAGAAVFARDLNGQGAMATLMKEAIMPNLVQTLEGNPAILHGGPFANIAQGTNTILATRMGLSLSDYVVTEAGFGADLGAEKFFNIKCRKAGFVPKATVIVATVRALKYHGGVSLKELMIENLNALEKGLANLDKHIENVQSFGMPVVVSINRFVSDTEGELSMIRQHCQSLGIEVTVSNGWAEGGKGCAELAEKVHKVVQKGHVNFKYTYDLEESIVTKIYKIATNIYGAADVEFSIKAKGQIKRFEALGLGKLPVCIAKTQKSLSDDEKRIGRPKGFVLHIREFEAAVGAGFIVPIAGDIMRMPGLPQTPSAERIDIDETGLVKGLF